MNAKHTQGPWRIGDAGHTVFGPPNGNPSPETVASGLTRANASLIARAPTMQAEIDRLQAHNLELREALQAMVNIWEGPRERAAIAFAAAVVNSRAALAKAGA